MTAEEWLSGKTAEPNFVSLEDGATPVAAPPAPASTFNQSAPTSAAPTPKSTLPPPTPSATLPPPGSKEEVKPKKEEPASFIEKVKETILPSSTTTAEPEAKDLDVPAAEEEDSEDELAAKLAAVRSVGTPVGEPVQAPLATPAVSNGSSEVRSQFSSCLSSDFTDRIFHLLAQQKDEENKRLKEELRDARAKIRNLELQGAPIPVL